MNDSAELRHRPIIAAVLSFAAFYLPFLGGAGRTHLSPVDNLDSTFVLESIPGLFLRDPAQARHLLLGGNLPIYLLPCFTWPVTLIHLIGNHFLAYPSVPT